MSQSEPDPPAIVPTDAPVSIPPPVATTTVSDSSPAPTTDTTPDTDPASTTASSPSENAPAFVWLSCLDRLILALMLDGRSLHAIRHVLRQSDQDFSKQKIANNEEVIVERQHFLRDISITAVDSVMDQLEFWCSSGGFAQLARAMDFESNSNRKDRAKIAKVRRANNQHAADMYGYTKMWWLSGTEGNVPGKQRFRHDLENWWRTGVLHGKTIP